MKNKKIIILISSILVFISLTIIIISIISSRKVENNKVDDESNWDRKVYLPINIKYNDERRISTLYLKNKEVNFGKEYESFSSFINVSQNNIALNAYYNEGVDKTLYIINLSGAIEKNVTDMIKEETSKKYSGYFNFTNDHLEIYFVDDDMCKNSNSKVDKLYVKTRNDVIEFVKKEQIDKKDFLEKNSSYC